MNTYRRLLGGIEAFEGPALGNSLMNTCSISIPHIHSKVELQEMVLSRTIPHYHDLADVLVETILLEYFHLV